MSTEEWVELPQLSWKELLLLWVGKRARFCITGNSMLPLLKPGDEVLVNPKAYAKQSPEPGDWVIAIHPFQPMQKIIKEVVAVEGDRFLIMGKNAAESTDSRSFGWLTKEQRRLQGRVVCRFS